MSKQAPPPNFASNLLCRTSCVATAYSSVRLSPRQMLSCTTVRGSTPFARRQVQQLFFHVHPWRYPTTPSSVPPAAVWVRTARASRPLMLGFPACPLSVSTHPVLTSAFPVSRKHVSLNTSRVYFVTPSVLHLLTSGFGAQIRIKPPSFGLVSVPPLPQTEQRLLVVMDESSHFILETNNPSQPLSITHLILLFPRVHLLLVFFSSVLPSLVRLLAPTQRIACAHRSSRPYKHARANVAPMHFFRNRMHVCRELVMMRTLVLTRPDPSLTHAVNPDIHMSTSCVRTSHVPMIRVMHSILKSASAVCPCSK